MATKTYEILGEQFGVLTIQDGPAKGRYQFNLDSSVEGGLLTLGTYFINGQDRTVKVNIQTDLPELFALMMDRKAAFVAKLEAAREGDIARQNFDNKMAAEGFETGGNASLGNFNGKNF